MLNGPPQRRRDFGPGVVGPAISFHSNHKPNPSMSTNQRRGFTRTELAVVIGVATILAGLLLPALANPRGKGVAITCLGNLRLLIQAWALYSDDNNDRLVMNFHGAETYRGAVVTSNGGRNAPWAVGWIDWTTSADNTNVSYLIDPQYAKLAAYFAPDANLHKCPADQSVSSAQRAEGWTERARSLSMNLGIGDGNAESGPWNPVMYKHIKTTSQFVYPAPGQTFVFLDENPDSINDPGFCCPQTATAWTDQPASYHDGAGSFAFADGHVELKKWTASLAAPRARKTQFVAATTATATAGDADLRWVNYRAGRSSTNAF